MKPHKRMVLVPTAYLAELAKITPQALNRRAVARGIQPAMQVGRAKLWDAKDVEKLLAGIGRGWHAKYFRESKGWTRKAS